MELSKNIIQVKMPIGEIIFRRMAKELVLVGVLDEVHKDGTPVDREDILKELELSIIAEREYINNNPQKAVKTYSYFYDGDEQTAKDVIEHLKATDYVAHYRKVLGMPTDAEVVEKFDKLIQEGMADEEFWIWVGTWKDVSGIIEEAQAWDTETKRREIPTIEKIIKEGEEREKAKQV